jgi:hypothetical protein
MRRGDEEDGDDMYGKMITLVFLTVFLGVLAVVFGVLFCTRPRNSTGQSTTTEIKSTTTSSPIAGNGA